MERTTPDLFCVLAIFGASAFALSTISTHSDIASASAIFLRAPRYGARPLPIQTFAPVALAHTCAAAHVSGRKLIRPPAQAVQGFSFRMRSIYGRLSAHPETSSAPANRILRDSVKFFQTWKGSLEIFHIFVRQVAI